MSPRTLEQRLKVYDRYLATVSAIAIVVGGLFTFYTYLHGERIRDAQEHKLKEKEIAQTQQELSLRQKELTFAIFKDKRDAYLALTDAASAIAACRSYEEVETASKEFLKLYYGRAHIIAEGDNDVYQKKIAFRRALAKYLDEKPTGQPYTFFENLALEITDACRQHLDPRLAGSK
jgi:hypothetical protein